MIRFLLQFINPVITQDPKKAPVIADINASFSPVNKNKQVSGN